MDRYPTAHAFLAHDLFETFKDKGLHVKRNDYRPPADGGGGHAPGWWQNKKYFYGAIFAYCLYLVLLDVIEKNVTFVLPTQSRRVYIHVQPVRGEELLKEISRGRYKGLDILSSDFTANKLRFRYALKDGWSDKPIYVSDP